MNQYYNIEFKKRAVKDLQKLPKTEAQNIINRIKLLKNNLEGDVKRLTNFTPEFRLRVRIYRVLFEIEKDNIIIHRIKHRKEAYK